MEHSSRALHQTFSRLKATRLESAEAPDRIEQIFCLLRGVCCIRWEDTACEPTVFYRNVFPAI